MAITNSNSVNSSNIQNLLMTRMMQSLCKASGLDLDISSALAGNSGSSLAMLDMSNMMQMMMQMMMMAKMFEAMGMDNPFTSSSSSSSSGTSGTSGTSGSTTSTSVAPGTNTIVQASNITLNDKLNNSTSGKVTGTTIDADTNDLSTFIIGDTTYTRVDGISTTATTFKNVFQTETGTYYYYNNGTLSEIDNVGAKATSPSFTEGTRVAYNNGIYTIRTAGTNLTLTNTSNTNLVANATHLEDNVYKIGNATYELISGVFVPRDTTPKAGGTLEITTLNNNTTTTDTKSRVKSYTAGSTLVITHQDNTETTYKKYNDIHKRFKTNYTFYTNGGKYFIITGSELKQISENDPTYLNGYNDSTEFFGNNNLGLRTDEDGDGNADYEYYEVTENGTTRLMRRQTNNPAAQPSDVTNDITAFSEVNLSGSSNKYRITHSNGNIMVNFGNGTGATLVVPASTDNSVQYKDNVYQCTSSTNNSLLANTFYKFTGGVLKEVSGVDAYKSISFDSAQYSGGKLQVDSSSIILTKADNTKTKFLKEPGDNIEANIYTNGNEYYRFENGTLNKINRKEIFKNLIDNQGMTIDDIDSYKQVINDTTYNKNTYNYLYKKGSEYYQLSSSGKMELLTKAELDSKYRTSSS